VWCVHRDGVCPDAPEPHGASKARREGGGSGRGRTATVWTSPLRGGGPGDRRAARGDPFGEGFPGFWGDSFGEGFPGFWGINMVRIPSGSFPRIPQRIQWQGCQMERPGVCVCAADERESRVQSATRPAALRGVGRQKGAPRVGGAGRPTSHPDRFCFALSPSSTAFAPISRFHTLKALGRTDAVIGVSAAPVSVLARSSAACEGWTQRSCFRITRIAFQVE
jgi:hypothetical protein